MAKGKRKDGKFKAKRQLTQEDFLIRANVVHGEKYDYRESVYISYHEKIKILCKNHGFFYQITSDHLSGRGCRLCYDDSRKSWTEEEDKFLTKNYCELNLSAKRIAQEMGKTLNSIYGRVQFLNLSKKQTPFVGEFPRHVWDNTKARAKEKNFEIDISEEYLNDILIKQNFLCALSGIKLISSKDNIRNTISVDRINSSKGYIKGNVQIVHKDANLSKRSLNEFYFYILSKNISEHLGKRYSKIEWQTDLENDTEIPVRVISEIPTPEKEYHKNYEDLF